MKTKMINKVFSIVVVTALFSTLNSNAQTTPEPPTPPSTTSYSSSSTSHSVTIEDDDDQHSSSVSISISDDSYKFRASYHKSKNEGVKAMVLSQLGKDNLKISGSTYLWENKQGGDDMFECKLSNGNLKMYVDTNAVSKSFMDQITQLGKDLKHYISGSSAKAEQAKNAEEAKHRLKQAEKELERAKRELERAEREAKKSREN